MSKSQEEQAFKYAIKNAALHDGKANMGAVVGKLKALFADDDIKELSLIAKTATDRVNKMKKEEIQKQFEVFEKEGYELKPKEKEKGLPSLEWAEKGEPVSMCVCEEGSMVERVLFQKVPVVTRFAPNPNGPMHFGHCRAAILSAEYAKKYNGKFLLRFEDTDPKVKKPMENAQETFLRDLAWLGYSPDGVSWASDRFDPYYDYMKQVLAMGKAYVCTCDNEGFKKLKNKGIACPHRERDPVIQRSEFDKMLNHEYKEWQAVLRIKTDLNHPDLSVRDWWAAKIVDKVAYSRLKNRVVFPSFNFQNSVDDHEEGVTLILRGVQHTQNAVKQKYLYGYLGWKFPHIIHFGLVKMKGILLSKTKINDLMKNDSSFLGFLDPRLGTVEAFREKGFVSQALVDEMLELGTRPSDASISLARLEDRNKQFIDKKSKRFILIEEPVEVVVNNAEKIEARLENYPGDPSAGVRKYGLGSGKQVFWIAKDEAENAILGRVLRLKHAYNVRVVKKDGKKIDCEFVSIEHKTGIPIVNWLIPSEVQSVEIRMLDASLKKGYSEKELARQKIGAHVRFEDFGFLVIAKNAQTGTKLNYSHP
ncbi:MAG: glutamate--tRNA ligase [Candidatus Diapherotrites archaeon]|uniref:Glutamate--tRNA ligase n=1 Tax=Candidatus Iainarchaeum sp. TaxID=3101447 RepID=A0A8T4L6C4_9ARCH|nr:glutamate--tRNA ligase [Candidatus Diapherotrites archaeon]